VQRIANGPAEIGVKEWTAPGELPFGVRIPVVERSAAPRLQRWIRSRYLGTAYLIATLVLRWLSRLPATIITAHIAKTSNRSMGPHAGPAGSLTRIPSSAVTGSGWGDNSKQSGGFAGSMRAEAYGPGVDPYSYSTTHGHFGQLQKGDIAISPDQLASHPYGSRLGRNRR
jgi:hypothetical protein